MEYPDRVTVIHKLASKPDNTSDHILLEAIIISEEHRRPAARCFEDIVVYDYRAAKKTPLKGHMVEELRQIYDLQEESKRDYEEKAANLIRFVDQIESTTPKQ